MGRTTVVMKHEKVPEHRLNKRFTCELCEDVHIHYRNFRIEFTKEEFLYILSQLRKIDPKEVENFHYSDWAYKELIVDRNLPDKTIYNNRLQIELQKEGHYHLHYKNLRVEVNKLRELGFSKYYAYPKILLWKMRERFYKIQKRIIKLLFGSKKTERLLDKYRIDLQFFKKKLLGKKYRLAYMQKVSLDKLKCVLAVKEGTHIYEFGDTPAEKYLAGDNRVLEDYFAFKNKKQKTNYSCKKFDELFLKIKQNKSFANEQCIIVNEKNEIIDGYLRVCCLRAICKNKKKIKVLKIFMK